MKVSFQKWFYYLLSSVLVACAMQLYDLKVCRSLGINTGFYPSFVFVVGLLGYIFPRLVSNIKISKNIFRITILVATYLLVASCVFLELNIEQSVLLCSLFFLTVFYVSPIQTMRSLRLIKLFKPFLTAFCWVLLVVLFPFLGKMQSFPALLCFNIFSAIWITAVLFDIKDKYDDAKIELITFANTFSKVKLNIILISVLVFRFLINILVGISMDEIIFSILLAILVYLSGSLKGSFFYYFVIDAVLCLYGLLMLF
ncbi:MAG: hypothetical protein U0V72_12860 [Cytophagales bacterium]